MNPELNNWLQLVFRWLHVVAGIMWIGHLYFFNFVNGPFAKTMDGATKKAVVPELMPRALYWFRWGAAWTWFTGFFLAGLVYYVGGALFESPEVAGNSGLWLLIVIVVMVVGFLVYNAIMKAIKNVIVANLIVLVLLAGAYLLMACVGHFGGRALYMHVGALLGTIMALNVWMVIWPSQKKIITAIKEGNAPDANLVALAGFRSRQNTFMSVPLVFFMVSNHYPTVYGSSLRDVYAIAILAVGFLLAWLMYQKSANVKGF